MRNRGDLIVLLVLASAACAAVITAAPGDKTVAFHVYLLVVGGLVLVGVLAAIHGAVPGRRRSELTHALDARAPADAQVSELAKLDREVTLAVGNAYDLHTRLLPQLREIADARLERTGRQAGPDTLGRWWELLRPDRPEPTDHYARGIAADDLRALVADLERM
jgi:hypothetical protein